MDVGAFFVMIIELPNCFRNHHVEIENERTMLTCLNIRLKLEKDLEKLCLLTNK